MKQTRSLRLMVGLGAACLSSPLLAQLPVEEVHVTATPINQSPEDLAQSVTVISGDQLDRIRASNLGETLAGELGLSASYFGTGSSRPIIRGLAGPRVRMMEDGIDSLDVSTVSVDHAVSIDPLAAEQIEIFRGPTTLLYGSGAVGGVINTVTNRLPDVAPEDGFDGALEFRGDTVANDRAVSLALDGGSDTLVWHLDALTRDTDDYEIPGFAELEEHYHDEEEEDHEDEEHHEEVFGLLENSDIEIDTFAGGLSWLGESGFFGVSVSSFATNYGLPGHEHHHEEEEGELARIDLEQTRIDLKGGWLDPDGAIRALNLRFGINDYEHAELAGEEDPTLFGNDAWEGRVEIVHAPLGAWSGAVGLQFGERDFSAIGEEAFVPPTETRTFGVFAIEQREFDRWQLSLGARTESQKHKPTGPAPRVSGTATSVSLAAIRELSNGYSLAFNSAIAERLPVADELYSNGPHLATGNIEIGDASLGAETSRHLDLGLRKTSGSVTWTITAFTTDYDDYIYLRNTGDFGDEVLGELPIYAYSRQGASFQGVEAELFTPIVAIGNGELDIRLFADYVEGELDNGDYVPRLPPRRFGARLEYHADRLTTGLEVTEHDDQGKTAPLEEPTPGYTMVNADLSWNIRNDSRFRLDVRLRASNLLDEDARRHTSFLKDSTPLPGRNYGVALRTQF